ncbi:unnamed protein product, partial [Prorocentrum cordatum]
PSCSTAGLWSAMVGGATGLGTGSVAANGVTFPSRGICSEDNAALLDGRISAQHTETRLLLAQYEDLRQHDAVTLEALPAGCSEPADAAAGAEPERFTLLASFQHSAPIAAVAVSTDDVVATASWDGLATFFDIPRWHDSGRFDVASSSGVTNGMDTALVAAGFVPTSPEVIGVAAACQVQLWHLDAGNFSKQAVLEKSQSSALISSMCFHPSQQCLVTTADDGVSRMWDICENCILRELQCSNSQLTGCSFLGDGDLYELLLVVSCLNTGACVWDVRRPQCVHTMEVSSGVACVTCNPDAHLICAGRLDGAIDLWDTRMWKEQRTLETRQLAGPKARPRSLAFSPEGALLAAGCLDGELLVFDVTRQQRAFKVLHHSDAVCSLSWGGPVAWAGAPGFLACGSLDGSWSCWAHRCARAPP